ncbi:MAG: GtrA family protein [Oceanospirillaceae bacterium]|nr:GtrA family protein [Oceanospirillaceae bacterium]
MKSQVLEVSRYAINGLVATVVHYSVLTVNLSLLEFESAGLANFFAAIFGITVSFLGSRYYVFNRATEGFLQQALKFSGLYGVIAVLHGLLLFIWTDRLGLDYRLGFLVATVVQILMSYFGNKFLVFKA